MQLFLAAAAIASAPTFACFLGWQHERIVRKHAQEHRDLLDGHCRNLARELIPLRLADQKRRARLSAAVAKGNRTRSWRRAAESFDASKYTPATTFNLHAGARVVVDDGFPCVKPGTRHFVRSDDKGLHIACADGRHYLDGQLDAGTTYVGVYLAPSPRTDRAPAQAVAA